MSEHQPLYKELFTLLSRRQEAESLHIQTLSDLAFKFRDAVHEQLGFPHETFTKAVNEQAADEQTVMQDEPWVRVYEFAEGQMRPVTGSVLSTIREDGSLSFAIGVSLSAELDSHPKYHFWAGYMLAMHTSTETPVLSALSGKPREYRIINNDFGKAVDGFVDDIKGLLDPASLFRAKKNAECIGFFCSN